VLGLHFFNPPHQMPLVEIVRTQQTSPQALARGLALVNRIGKTKVIVGDCAGFLVNRLLAPYMGEAGYLVSEVADPLQIERAAIEFGMPMGPLELIGLVGIEVAAHVGQNMQDAYGERFEPAPFWSRLEQLAASGGKNLRLLKKTRKGKRLNPAVAAAISELRVGAPGGSVSEQTIVERLIYPIINEAARCLEEGIVERPEDIDLAMVFGTGFAPFRGGPLRYADTVGIANIVIKLDQFAANHPRLAPCEALRRRAGEGGSFMKPIEEQLAAAVS
jgi:3-hydroxyacyl-CoA dehydrogenase/enoyl-CoA hydratase/3-hydroxybutyryl-CoA epimerase